MKNAAIITLDAIYPAQEGKNQDYMTMQLSTEVSGGGGNAGANGIFLGEQFTSKRVAFQSIHKDQLATMSAEGLVEGADINSVLDVEFQIKATEQTQPEYDALSDDAKLGYQEKQFTNDDNKVVKLTAGGLPIWRKVELCGAEEGADKLVKSDKRDAVAKAPVGEEVTTEA